MKRILLLLTVLFLSGSAYSQADTIYMEGFVYESDSVTPIDSAFIIAEHIEGYSFSDEAFSETSGYYIIDTLRLAGPGPEWKYKVTVSKLGFYSLVDTIYFDANSIPGVEQDFYLVPLEPSGIHGIVELDPPGGNIVDVDIHIMPLDTTIHPDDTGFYEILDIPSGAYTLEASLPDYISEMVDTVLIPGQIEVINFVLEEFSATIESDVGIICPNETFELNAIANGGFGAYEYKWVWDDNDTLITENTSISINNIDETTEVHLTITDFWGNFATDSIPIEVYTAPEFNQQPESQIACEGSTLSFTIDVLDSNNVSYQWQSNHSGSWDDLYDSQYVSGPKSKELKLTNLNMIYDNSEVRCIASRCDMENSSDSALVNVNPLPDSTLIIKGDPAVVLITPDSGSFYQWYYNDTVLIHGETKQFYYPGSLGFEDYEYSVLITNEDGCERMSMKVSTTMIQKYLDENSKKVNELSVYPNPSSGKVFLEIPHNILEKDISLIICELSGKIVMNESIIDPSQTPLTIDLSHLSKGYYLIRLKASEETFMNKIIIK